MALPSTPETDHPPLVERFLALHDSRADLTSSTRVSPPSSARENLRLPATPGEAEALLDPPMAGAQAIVGRPILQLPSSAEPIPPPHNMAGDSLPLKPIPSHPTAISHRQARQETNRVPIGSQRQWGKLERKVDYINTPDATAKEAGPPSLSDGSWTVKGNLEVDDNKAAQLKDWASSVLPVSPSAEQATVASPGLASPPSLSRPNSTRPDVPATTAYYSKDERESVVSPRPISGAVNCSVAWSG